VTKWRHIFSNLIGMDEIELPLRCRAQRFLLGSQEELGQTPGGDHGTDALLEALARCACRGRTQAHDPEEGRRFLKRHAPVRRRLPRGRGEVMNAIALSCITFVCILGGALLGMLLPGHRLSAEDKDVVRLGTGLIGTIAALVLGLLIASAKSSYDTQSTQIRQMTANIILLDNLLAQYGPDANASRDLLRRGIVLLVDRMWRDNSSDAKAAPFAASDASEAFYAKVQQLAPQNDAQRSLQARAMQISTDIAQTRLLLFAQAGNSVPMPFLVVLIFWLTMIFVSFGLFARPSVNVIGCLLIFAISAAGAIYLILELGQPFAGLMEISSAPLRNALPPLGS
jgi:hypothetical protein